MVAMVLKLITSGNKSFKLLSSIIRFNNKEDVSIITRKERERLVLELYNQDKTIYEVAKEVS